MKRYQLRLPSLVKGTALNSLRKTLVVEGSGYFAAAIISPYISD
jgi:hypothetical protein